VSETTETTGTEEGTSDSATLQAVRESEKRAKARTKELEGQLAEQEETIRASVRRESEAASLMEKAGFAGLADVFAAEVEGELSEQAAIAWLTKRGLAAPNSKEGDAEGTAALADVAGTGSSVAAAAAGNDETNFDKRLDKVESEFKGSPMDLADAIAAEFNDLG